MELAAARFALVVTPLAAAVLLASCDGGSIQPSAGEAGLPPAETVRGCRTAVYGEIAPETRKDAVTAGPLTLLVANGGRRAPVEAAVKVLALVRAGETATVVVPRPARSRLSLLYDFSRPGPRRPLRLSDGSSSVRFSACTRSEEWAEGRPYPDPRETQFNGGFFVRDAQCASLDVWVEGRAEPLQLSLGLDGGDRRCPPRRAS
jgi:LSD1 subclass zinc finger protein